MGNPYQQEQNNMAAAFAAEQEALEKAAEQKAIREAMDEAKQSGVNLDQQTTASTSNLPSKADYDQLDDLPDLDQADVVPVNLLAGYWTPAKVGEYKNLFFNYVGSRTVLDQKTGETFELECVFFLERDAEGKAQQVANGSVKLCTAFAQAAPKRLTPFRVTYLGKVKNSTNSNMSDNWRVEPLKLKKRWVY